MKYRIDGPVVTLLTVDVPSADTPPFITTLPAAPAPKDAEQALSEISLFGQLQEALEKIDALVRERDAILIVNKRLAQERDEMEAQLAAKPVAAPLIPCTCHDATACRLCPNSRKCTRIVAHGITAAAQGEVKS